MLKCRHLVLASVGAILLSALVTSWGDDRSVMVVARTIYGEARGESYYGKLCVATVIWNRAHGEQKNFIRVCLRKKQFSCWNKNPTADPAKMKAVSGEAWRDCLEIARKMHKKKFEPVADWDHYYAHKLVKPYWAASLTNVVVIGNHTFGKHR